MRSVAALSLSSHRLLAADEDEVATLKRQKEDNLSSNREVTSRYFFCLFVCAAAPAVWEGFGVFFGGMKIFFLSRCLCVMGVKPL